MIKLNRYQRLAFENPIIEGQPPLNMPEGWSVHGETIDDQAVTVGLTVDVDTDNRAEHDTDAVWQVSVSVWPTSVAEKLSEPDGVPIELSKWTVRHKEIAAKAQARNVEGISVSGGEPIDPQPEGTVLEGTYALHLRLPLNDEEREGLPVESK